MASGEKDGVAYALGFRVYNYRVCVELQIPRLRGFRKASPAFRCLCSHGSDHDSQRKPAKCVLICRCPKQTLLGGPWDLVTTYNRAYNPNYNPPKGACRGYPNYK